MILDSQQAIFDLEQEVFNQRNKIEELKEKQEAKEVPDYTFQTLKGEISLSDLFGDHSTLILLHNMGKQCPYCTMWADGLNLTYEQISQRTAFVLSSPDAPDVQREFAVAKNWQLPMVSLADSSFKEDFKSVITYGGLSVFLKDEEGTIKLSTQTLFGPGDEFGILYHLLNLLPGEVIN